MRGVQQGGDTNEAAQHLHNTPGLSTHANVLARVAPTCHDDRHDNRDRVHVAGALLLLLLCTQLVNQLIYAHL
jgi:hypothetical protein